MKLAETILRLQQARLALKKLRLRFYDGIGKDCYEEGDQNILEGMGKLDEACKTTTKRSYFMDCTPQQRHDIFSY